MQIESTAPMFLFVFSCSVFDLFSMTETLNASSTKRFFFAIRRSLKTYGLNKRQSKLTLANILTIG